MASYDLSLWIPVLLLFSVILFLITKKKTFKTQHKQTLPPPSPPSLPFLGNLHQLSDLLHQSYCQLSKEYGPVMLVKLGKIPTLVISSAETASQVLKVNDIVCCSRPQFEGAGKLSYNYLDIGFAPYGDHWRNMKKLLFLELFSQKRVQSFRYIREEEVELFLNSIADSAASKTPINLTDKLLALTATITFRMAFGIDDYRGTEFGKDRFHEMVFEAFSVTGGFTKRELFPYFGWILDWISGYHVKAERIFRQLDSFFEYIIEDHLKPGRNKERDDVIDVLLGIKKEKDQLGLDDYTYDNIKAVLVDIFGAGIDTTAITVNWAMAELCKNPKLMKKAQDEVRNIVGKKGRVSEDDIDKLEYLKMVIKETFRLHPPAPLLLPRETTSQCEIGGYYIKPKTVIQVNAWAIGRDPKSWNDPEQFIPERFADSSIDFKGQNFELLPFGAGRRICPGLRMGMVTVEIVLANLLYCFDWKLPDGMKEEDINMEERAGFSLTISKKTPLNLLPVEH